MGKTLAEISEAMRDIDFCAITSHSGDGSIPGRPMSNNGNVEYNGEAWFFTYDDRLLVRDVEKDPNVGVTYVGKAGIGGLLGKPGLFIHVEGTASIVRDKARFGEFWYSDLDRWFPNGADTPGIVLVQVKAQRITYWEGADKGEITF